MNTSERMNEVIAYIEDNITADIYEIFSNSHALTVGAIRENGYEVDWRNFFQCEVYTDQRYGIPKSRGEKIRILDFYVPCKKAGIPDSKLCFKGGGKCAL